MASYTQAHAENLLATAIKESSIPALSSALDYMVQSESIPAYESFVVHALRTSIQAGNIPLTTHLLATEETPLISIRPIDIFPAASVPLFEVLLLHGWDLNAAGVKSSIEKGKRMIDWVCGDNELVAWLVAHGAEVDGGEDVGMYAVEARPAVLTETCAAVGSVETFKLLQSKEAQVGRRVLHVAAGQAAKCGADPSAGDTCATDSDDQRETKRRRGEMLTFLVDQLGLDVNALDSDVKRNGHWGRPLDYAEREADGGAVARWLLAKGAKPL